MQKVAILLLCLCFYLNKVVAQTSRPWDKPAHLKSCSIYITADLFTATTFIEMEFYNAGDSEIEGLYTFQLHPGQVITALQLDLNGKYRDGSIEERWKAQNTYNSIVGKRIDPALLQMHGLNDYSLRVYPIPAKGSRKVTITIQQLLKPTTSALTYSLPLNRKDTTSQFNVAIKVYNTENRPFVNKGLVQGLFLLQGTSFYLSQQEQNFRLDGNIAFSIPINNAAPFLCTKQVGNKIHFALRTKPKQDYQSPIVPKQIAVYWDASASSEKRNVEKEITFLKQYISYYKIEHLVLIPFSYKPLDTASFTLNNSNSNHWISYLRSLEYDGGTQLGSLDMSGVKADVVLLFSDGINTYGKSFPKTGKASVYSVHAARNANTAVLSTIVGSSGGSLIDLTKLSMGEAIQVAGKEQIQLLHIQSTSGKTIINQQWVDTTLQQLTVVGIAYGGIDTLLLTYGNNSREATTEAVRINTLQHCENSAIDRIPLLYEFDKTIRFLDWYSMVGFGKKHKVVTPNTSFIVLERVEDYVNYDIEPPAELKEECEKLINVKQNRVDRWKLYQEWNAFNMLQGVVASYNQRIQWWDRTASPIRLLSSNSIAGGSKEKSDADAVNLLSNALSGKVSGLSITNNNALEEVVVTGYGMSRRQGLSYSVTTIRKQDISSAATSVEQALAGRVAGVEVNNANNGLAGGTATIRIRGAASVTNNRQPLFVLDGIPVSGDINHLVNVHDIERIEVLKDAAATALYGSQGANGVILIVTKRGRDTRYQYSTIPYKLKNMEDVEYLQELKAARKNEKLHTYQKLQQYYGNGAGFYFDVAQHFFDIGLYEEALHILTNAAEYADGDVQVLTAIGYTLESWKEYAAAATIYEEVMKRSNDDIQAYRNLAWAYYRLGNYQKAIDLLYETIMKSWEQQEYAVKEAKATLLNELNAIIAVHKGQLDISKIDTSLIKPLPVDLRIVVDGNKTNSYNFVSVVEPGGVIANGYYYDGNSKNKGRMLQVGYYTSYPAEYEIKAAVKGKYMVRVHYNDYNGQRKDIPTFMRVMTFKNFGKEGQSIQIENVIMDNQSGVVDIAEIKY
jgi:TonB-dependent SusC/RagA subfamily outer membrane receptor